MDVNEPPQGNEAPEKKEYSSIKIVGLNLIALAVYGVIFNLPPDGDWLIFYAFAIVFHFVFCIGAAIYKRNGMWLLSGLMVLVIGLSTCVGSF